MSYTILTIPFNFKEKTGGEFLKNGFVFDDIFEKYLSEVNNQQHIKKNEYKNHNPFLHIAEFNSQAIKRAIIEAFLNENLNQFQSRNKNNCFTSTSFFDKKYLTSSEGYVNLIDPNILNKVIQEDNSILENNRLEFDLNFFDIKCTYQKEKDKTISFDIEKVKIFFNKHKTTTQIGFGYIEIDLKWDFKNAVEMISKLEPFSELFRYYGTIDGNKPKNDFFIFDNPKQNEWNIQIDKKIEELERYNEKEKIKDEVKENNNKKIQKLQNLKIDDNNIKTIHFELIINNLLKLFTDENKTTDFIFQFSMNKSVIKPYLLHLSNISKIESVDKNNINNINIDNIHRLIRISGDNYEEINDDYQFESLIPDRFTRQYILNEGALIIEGITQVNELKNKYYPAFLLALNQKYLFNYMQEKINQLPLETKKDCIRYNADLLRKLQETMIFAEFSQIFTSISNYNEIDLFFEKLRDKFKIKELKEEFLDSINGISKIYMIEEREITEYLRLKQEEQRRNDKEENENLRLKKEEIEKQKEKKIQLILFIISFLSVFSAVTDFFDLFNLKNFHEPWFAIVVLILLFSSIFFFIRLYSKKK